MEEDILRPEGDAKTRAQSLEEYNMIFQRVWIDNLEHDAKNCDNFSGADQILMQIYFLESEINNEFKENEINDAWGLILM